MTDEVKKPVRKRAPRKVSAPAAKATVAKAPAARKKPAEKTPVYIRNLRRIEVHFRMDNPMREKPFRVVLKPRGSAGDACLIPVEIQSSLEFIQGLRDSLFEIISTEEMLDIQYAPVGYSQPTPVVIREADTVIGTAPDWDNSPRNPANQERNRRVRPRPVNPNYADVPGSNAGLHQGLRDAGMADQRGALPPGTNFDRQQVVPVERTRIS